MSVTRFENPLKGETMMRSFKKIIATLLLFATILVPSFAAHAESLNAILKYSISMAERPALRSLIGQTYFRQGNYAEAIRLLQPLQDMDDYEIGRASCRERV